MTSENSFDVLNTEQEISCLRDMAFINFSDFHTGIASTSQSAHTLSVVNTSFGKAFFTLE